MRVRHWRYDTGEPVYVGASVVYPTGYRPGADRGWYCWVYPDPDDDFDTWMKTNCPTADCSLRFNGGDCFTGVHITSESEASIFALRWL